RPEIASFNSDALSASGTELSGSHTRNLRQAVNQLTSRGTIPGNQNLAGFSDGNPSRALECTLLRCADNVTAPQYDVHVVGTRIGHINVSSRINRNTSWRCESYRSGNL